MLTMYSKSNCPACVSAKALLTSYGIDYQEIKIDEDQDAKQFILSKNHRTVPQIYNGADIFVEGGYLGLKQMSESQIKKLLYGDIML